MSIILDRYPIASMVRAVALAATVLISSSSTQAQFFPPQLRSLSQSIGEPGDSFELRIGTGNHLTEVDRLRFSHPGITAQAKRLPPLPFSETPRTDFGHFEVTIAADVQPGRYEVRAEGRHGLSNPRVFWISPLSVTHLATEPTTPSQVPLGTAVSAHATAANVHVFQVDLSNDQHIQCNLLAQTIDSRMIGQIEIRDPGGRPIERRRGYDHFDPQVAFTVTEAGTYTVLVHDVLYRGGDEYPYVLAIQNAADARPLIQGAPSEASTGRLPRHLEPKSVGVAPVTSIPATDPEDSDSPVSPEPLQLPAVVDGWFATGEESHTFHFSANQGDQLAASVLSERWGQPTDVRLQLQRLEHSGDGTETRHPIVIEDDSQAVSDGVVTLQTRDPQTLFSVPETGEYLATVRDLDIGESLSKRQRYQFSLRSPQPRFDLVAYRLYPHRDLNQSQPVGSKLFRGGAEVIRVMALRRDGWKGAIEIEAENLPDGILPANVTLAANQSKVDLVIRAGSEAGDATVPLRIVGRSQDGELQQAATPVTIQWGRGDGRDFIRSRISQDLWLCVSSEDLSPLSMTLGETTPTEIQAGQTKSMPIRVERREGADQPITLRPQSLPGGVSIGEVTIPADKSEATVEVKTAGNTAPGTYSLWMQAETKIKLPSNPQALARAQARRAQLQRLRDDPTNQNQLDAIDAALAEADKAIEAAQAEAKPQEQTIFFPTSNATLRVSQP